MGTIVGVRVRDGVVLGADRRIIENGILRSDDVRKLFEFDGAGVALEGRSGDIQSFASQLDTEIRQLEHRQGTAVRITALERLASRLAERTAVEGIVTARGADNDSRMYVIDRDGGSHEETMAACGTGSGLALGRLETVDLAVSLRDGTELVRETLRVVAERDTSTSEKVDIMDLPDGP